MSDADSSWICLPKPLGTPADLDQRLALDLADSVHTRHQKSVRSATHRQSGQAQIIIPPQLGAKDPPREKPQRHRNRAHNDTTTRNQNQPPLLTIPLGPGCRHHAPDDDGFGGGKDGKDCRHDILNPSARSSPSHMYRLPPNAGSLRPGFSVHCTSGPVRLSWLS
jgi:hypothetical protein